MMDIKPTKAERVHALVNAGQFPGMSEAFEAHMGSACWVDHAYRQDAATWAAAWKAALAAQAGPAQAPESTRPADASISGQRVDMTAVLDTLPRWLAIPRGASAVVLAQMPPPSTGPDVFVKLQDVAAALAAAPQAPAEQQKPIGNFAVGLGDLSPAEKRCACGDRPASQCPGEWEPGCDLGANEKRAKVAPAEPAAQAGGQDATLPVHEVWREGYRITGESEGAVKLGEAQAATFEEACDIVCRGKADYDAKTRRVWGCRLFNNEAGSRKAFG